MKQDDDGASLVSEVVKENPPEEKGEREEWDLHIGWHQKEDVRQNKHALRGTRRESDEAISRHQNSSIKLERMNDVAQIRNDPTISAFQQSIDNGLPVRAVQILMVIALLAFVFCVRFRTLRSKASLWRKAK